MPSSNAIRSLIWVSFEDPWDAKIGISGRGVLILVSDAFSDKVASQVNQIIPSAFSVSPGEKGEWMRVQRRETRTSDQLNRRMAGDQCHGKNKLYQLADYDCVHHGP